MVVHVCSRQGARHEWRIMVVHVCSMSVPDKVPCLSGGSWLSMSVPDKVPGMSGGAWFLMSIPDKVPCLSGGSWLSMSIPDKVPGMSGGSWLSMSVPDKVRGMGGGAWFPMSVPDKVPGLSGGSWLSMSAPEQAPKVEEEENACVSREFQAYVPDKRVLFIRDGKLYIKPMLTVDHPDFTEQSLSAGKIDLVALYGKCHMFWNKYGCVRFGQKSFVPPIMSARLHSVAAVKYGIFEVRAIIPLGDWLWPALWLRPRNSPYGSWPGDGEIDVMESRGNKGSWNVDMVRSTVHWGTSIRDRTRAGGTKRGATWHSQFHIYKVEWTPDHIATYVDSHRIMYLEAGTSMYDRGKFSGPNIWASGSKIAPFDQEFYFIMNVAVGGISGYFPDSPRRWNKPWRNNSPNPAKDFWDGRKWP
ncbi:hypothetical protein PoB_005650300 [Plakobranchus ocellatus]|uniref:GH16 domain-containing protein n=1 Tax=Plakobranchus ocellatus TaxID=259542 RepID=A0AAV4CG77_9GAST|nr:hypothetical protein PoB_005650300 [Plakobranchus ocellatus]